MSCACSSQDTGSTASIDSAAPDIAGLAFTTFTPWATPIQDYIETNTEILGDDSFLKAIYDLAVYQDRMYLGYGDANENLGRNTPIELRYWYEAEPGALETDFTVDEEQVGRYRVSDDLMMVPGEDATEDDLMGNAYTLPLGGSWFKSRTLEYAWHVHDIARMGETLYACGSGGTLDDYENSTVNAFLYRSDDMGETFSIQVQLEHPDPPGDHRFTNLLALDQGLMVFGYYYKMDSITGNTEYWGFPAYRLV